MAEARIVFHLPRRYMDDYRTIRHLRLFARVAETLGPLGARIVLRDRRAGPFDAGETTCYADGDLHLLEGGRARGPGVLNVALAYLPPYWHLDPQGVLAESSIGARVYDPARVRVEKAAALVAKLRARWVAPRRSRHRQAVDRVDLPQGAIAVFLQGGMPQEQGLAHMSALEMLRAVCAGCGGRAVLVKPHPLTLAQDLALIEAALAEGLALTPTLANLHDILEAAAVTVSFNSAVAMEGFLHDRPAILFGRSDFHHIAETVTRAEAFAPALARVLARPGGGHAGFVHWYFARNCLNVEGAGFVRAVLTEFAAAGFAPERLGIAAP